MHNFDRMTSISDYHTHFSTWFQCYFEVESVSSRVAGSARTFILQCQGPTKEQRPLLYFFEVIERRLRGWDFAMLGPGRRASYH